GQADRKAFSLWINTFTVIDIKQSKISQAFTGSFAGGLKNLLCRRLTIHQQRQIPAHFGEAGKLPIRGKATGDNFGQYQFEQIHRLVDTQLARKLRMQCADEANLTPVALDDRTLPRIQRAVFCNAERERTGSTRNTQQRLDIGLGIEEIDRILAI